MELILKLTCPPVNAENYEKDLTYVSVFGGTTFLFWAFNQNGFF